MPVYSSNTNIESTTNIIKDNDKIDLNFLEIKVIATPGHTLDHIIFYNKKNNFLIFRRYTFSIRLWQSI